ncbi:hypothetical protein ACFSOZ_20705 [Mesorhizobium newzealandense]|uniref:Uncharacterized protein n=1 Tax=Mesorhizobium newzealandense TaxID=1300302 RepID=A0ABW4UCW7_9HYPH
MVVNRVRLYLRFGPTEGLRAQSAKADRLSYIFSSCSRCGAVQLTMHLATPVLMASLFSRSASNDDCRASCPAFNYICTTTKYPLYVIGPAAVTVGHALGQPLVLIPKKPQAAQSGQMGVMYELDAIPLMVGHRRVSLSGGLSARIVPCTVISGSLDLAAHHLRISHPSCGLGRSLPGYGQGVIIGRRSRFL